MEYSIQELSTLAGVTTRTLRYYDEIDLLRPARINISGYRFYGCREVDRLQQILLYREMELPLKEIKNLLDSPDNDPLDTLCHHYMLLKAKQQKFTKLIDCVEKMIRHRKGEIVMSDEEKFKDLKRNLVEVNEKKYGKEIRDSYGDRAVNNSHNIVLNMKQEEHRDIKTIESRIKELLKEASEKEDIHCSQAEEAVILHKEYLTFYWGSYSVEAHKSMASLYTEDARFKAYYDEITPGCAEFFSKVLNYYLKEQG